MILRWMVRILLVLVIVPLMGVFATEFMNKSALLADDNQNKCTRLPDPKDSPKRPNSGVVKTIRLTNEGEFSNRCEYSDAMYELTWDRPLPAHCRHRRPNAALRPECSRPAIFPDAVEKPKLVILFVHGWTHFASHDDVKDDHFEKFAAQIKTIALSRQDKQVVGVYVTWNASTGSAMDVFSFWSRKGISDRITQSAAVTKIVGAISASRGVSGHRDQFVAIGHSFGARMLFAAVNAPLVLAVNKAYRPGALYTAIDSVADAVLLLNPAFEASRYATINSFMRNEETFSCDQRPLTIIVSTDNDSATGWYFPIGQSLSFLSDQRAKATVGNYSPYFTHSLKRSTAIECSSSAPSESYFERQTGLCLKRETDYHYRPGFAGKRSDWAQVLPEKQSCNPFWVVTTNKEVIDEHGGIWEGNVFPVWLMETLRL